jgi:hypothetical protein
MKDIKELYPQDGGYFCESSYQPILEDFGNILLQVDDADYQGDSRVLYQDGERYGYLNFGWGSCSGCDALQSCQSLEQIDELRNGLNRDIQWFDSREEALRFFEGRDWEVQYSWHAEETKEFVERAKALLRA